MADLRRLGAGLLALASAVLCGPLLLAEPVEAGVVVLKNGEVLVGRIRDNEISKDQITIRWPYKEQTERGEIEVPRFRIRWFDPKADEPTDEYWEKYGGERIENAWLPLYEKYKLRMKARETSLEGDFLLSADTFLGDGDLSAIPIENGNIKIQKPEGWTSSIDENGITIFESDKPGTEGFKARIHVFATRAAIGQTEDQVQWVEEAVSRLAADKRKFNVRERKRLRPKGGGFDAEMLTATTREETKVYTLRKMLFRPKNTYFFSAYAHERDYSNLEFLFKACMRSLELKEDSAPTGTGSTPVSSGSDAGEESSSSSDSGGGGAGNARDRMRRR